MTNLLAILCLLAWQETRGCADPLTATGDGGKALGRYQMHAAAVADVNARFRPVRAYTLADRADPIRGELLAMGYAIILAERFRAATGREPATRDMCGMWRRGAVGWINKGNKEVRP